MDTTQTIQTPPAANGHEQDLPRTTAPLDAAPDKPAKPGWLTDLFEGIDNYRRNRWDRRERTATAKHEYQLGKDKRRAEQSGERTDNRILIDGHEDMRRQRRLLNPVTRMGVTVQVRRLSLLACAVAALFAIGLGAINVRSEFVQLAELSGLLSWVAYAFEPMFTLPLLGIMIYEGTGRGRYGQTVSDPVLTALKWALMAGAMLLNSGLHLLNREFLQAALWLIVPMMLVGALVAYGRLSALFARILAADAAEIELREDLGGLGGEDAAVLRQAWRVHILDQRGEISGERDEQGLPSNAGIRKAYKAAFPGPMSVPTAARVKATLPLITGLNAAMAEPLPEPADQEE